MKLKSKVTGEIVTVVPYEEPISKGWTLGLGNVQGTTVRDEKGDYAFIKEDKRNLWEEVN